MSIPYIIITQKAPPGSGFEGRQISYARTVTRRKIGTEELAELIATISTVSVADVIAVLYALRDVAPGELGEGHCIDLAGLGSFHIFSCTGALETPELVSPLDFRHPRISYRPGKAFRKMLRSLRFKRKR